MNFFGKKYKVRELDMHATITVGGLAYNKSIRVDTRLMKNIIAKHKIDEDAIDISHIAIYIFGEALKREAKKSADIETIDALVEEFILHSL